MKNRKMISKLLVAALIVGIVVPAAIAFSLDGQTLVGVTDGTNIKIWR